LTSIEESEERASKPYGDELDVFLRVLTVNMLGGLLWALLQPLKDYDSSEVVFIAASGMVVGVILSIGSLLTPRVCSKFEKRAVYRMVCDLMYSLISIYLTVSMIFILTASAIMLAGGHLTIRSNGDIVASLSMGDLLNSYSLDYLLQLSIISIFGSPIAAILRCIKAKMSRCLHRNRHKNGILNRK